MSERLKILPLLILVAMLAFSVRLVEVVSGVRDLSGSAHAAAEKARSTDDASMPSQQKLAMADDAKENDNSAEGQSKPELEEETDHADIDVDNSKWRDASDSDGGVSAVKMQMFTDMAERRKELDKREQALVTREALLQAAEQEIDRKYQEMDALRTQIEKLLEEQSEEEKARIASLVKIYEGMKPKEAARIFDTLDLDILVNVMSLMSERKLSPILASMNPERARTVTIMLAEQKTLPELPGN
ncbi:MAG: flagellar protein FlbB [Micavibrio sp.]|nr:flagellar protein FlbB [Micavibrio sp.]|tara:strand:+ start:8528 stop:9259 length:732 start_codon:yes stop_codon:yes gene_type:complete